MEHHVCIPSLCLPRSVKQTPTLIQQIINFRSVCAVWCVSLCRVLDSISPLIKTKNTPLEQRDSYPRLLALLLADRVRACARVRPCVGRAEQLCNYGSLPRLYNSTLSGSARHNHVLWRPDRVLTAAGIGSNLIIYSLAQAHLWLFSF